MRQSRPLQSATIAINDPQQTFASAILANKRAILDALTGPPLRH